MTAADISNSPASFKLFLHAIQRGDPIGNQVGNIPRAEKTVGATKLACMLIAPGTSLSRTEDIYRGFMFCILGDDNLQQTLHIGRAIFCGENRYLLWRKVKLL